MGQALYRKYRSKKLSEIVGQEHITTTLANALKNDSISHAYLLTGPRGVGKTSIARILAHEVNDLTYSDETTHLDIIEIDAASNRRIDEIRELREKVHTAPTSAKYKVYIIDEVHMLTREAFNALLKTLEEPPDHAIFILATTEAHKVPETITSRTQRFTFRPIDNKKIVEHLRYIADKEGIRIADDALDLIAEHSGGSFRDSISLLDQVGHSGQVNLTDVQTVLGIAPEIAITEILDYTQSGQTTELVRLLSTLSQQGYQGPQLARQLSEKLRFLLIDRTANWSGNDITDLLQQLLNVPASHDPSALLELILLQSALRHETVQKPEPKVSKPDSDKYVAPSPSEPTHSQSPKKSIKPITTKKGRETLNETAWQEVLLALKGKHNTLYGIVRMAEPEFEGRELVLHFAFPFHKKRLDDDKHRQLLSEIIEQQTGVAPTITTTLDKTVRSTPQEEPESADVNGKSLDAISNIFGSGEVLE